MFVDLNKDVTKAMSIGDPKANRDATSIHKFKDTHRNVNMMHRKIEVEIDIDTNADVDMNVDMNVSTHSRALVTVTPTKGTSNFWKQPVESPHRPVLIWKEFSVREGLSHSHF